MPNITLTVPEEVLRAAKVRAAQNGTSVSGMVRDFLISVATASSEYDRLKGLESDARTRIAASRRPFSAADRLSRDELYDRAAMRREADNARLLGS
ncbi:MAG: DUF6364 family protein [Sporichthyaceae bacterium]